MSTHTTIRFWRYLRSSKVSPLGQQAKKDIPSASSRCQFTSTAEADDTHPMVLYATPSTDFSTAHEADINADRADAHWNALLYAMAAESFQLTQPRARQLDLIEAAESKDQYDKVLLLLNHGQVNDYDSDLSSRGIGSALSLSRRTATFCNPETGLLPELVVIAPSRACLQTALLSFPYYAPSVSTSRNVKWACHDFLMEQSYWNVPATKEEMKKWRLARGIDLSCVGSEAEIPSSIVDVKANTLRESERFLKWLQSRPERVIVVASHSTWLQTFCGCILKYEPRSAGMETFRNADMRAVGINYEQFSTSAGCH